MEFRYFINNKWAKDEAYRIMEAVEFVAKYYKLKTGVTTVKLITVDEVEATADRLKNNRFEIRLVKTKLKTDDEVLRAVFHEMTHIKQFMFDGLRLAGQATKWKTETFNSNTEYWFTPWEMEARAMEEPLLYLFNLEH